MIVLHGTWKPPSEIQERGNFFLWGESSTSQQIKRKSRQATPRPHPFQASQDEISRIITSFNSGDIKKKMLPDRTFILLPSYPDAPQASPDLIQEDEFDNGMEKVVLSTWQLDGLSLPPEEAVALLTSLSGFWTGIDGFAIGSDFRFWSKVSKFAMELLSKQHFVPGIVAS